MTLSEQGLSLLYFNDLRKLNHEFIRVETNFSEHFVVQSDLFQAQHLIVGFLTDRSPLKIVNELLHFIFTGWLSCYLLHGIILLLIW